MVALEWGVVEYLNITCDRGVVNKPFGFVVDIIPFKSPAAGCCFAV